MPWAEYTVEVAWSTALTGIFTVGSSTIGGTDTIGGTFGSETYSDITDDVLGVAITRGRTDDEELMMAGQCTVELEDYSGKYNPANASSPLYPNIRPMRPIRITATYNGVTYERFRGYIQSVDCLPLLGSRRATIQAADLFAWLQTTKPVIAATGPTTTGAAIGLVLDAIEYTSPSLRDLDTGDSIADFSADGSSSGLGLIKALLDGERGTFYVTGAGVAKYESRHAATLAPRDTDQSTLTDVMEGLTVGTDTQGLYNSATVTKTGGTAQTATDADSIEAYGQRDFPALTTPYLASDAAASSLAAYLVATHRNPRPRVALAAMGDAVEATLIAILARDLNDRVGISDGWGGTTGSYFIRQIQEAIGRGGALHMVEWALSEATTDAPFIVGQSTIGGTDIIVY